MESLSSDASTAQFSMPGGEGSSRELWVTAGSTEDLQGRIFREDLQGQTQLPGGPEWVVIGGFSGGAGSSGSAETPVATRAARAQVLDWLEWAPENPSTKDVGAPT